MNEKETKEMMERTAQSSFQVFTELVQLWASGARKVTCMNFLRPLFFCAASSHPGDLICIWSLKLLRK
jgi:hypothetical protein